MADCKNCKKTFEITQKDLDFYDKVSTVIESKKYPVPPPTLCPLCRQQRRLASRNERTLYKRTCDMCHKDVVSVFPKDSIFTVYCYDCYFSDKWDPLSYGKDYDFSQNFFPQLFELEKAIPHFALFQDNTSENCEYTNHGGFNKSCYLSLAIYCEEVYYSHFALRSKSCMDCEKILMSELCYECIDCTNCYGLFFSQDCTDCSDSYFLNDCRQSSNCFASSGLRNKKFVFENVQLTEEEYKMRMSELKFTNENIEKWENLLDKISLAIPKKYMHGVNNENVIGEYIDNSKNLYDVYDALDVQDCSYCDTIGLASKDMYDCSYGGLNSELCYEVNGFTTFNRTKFSYYGRSLHDSAYSKYCTSSDHLFGCLDLVQKKYCILNKQYTQEEYEELVPKIIEQMTRDKEYGEYFPITDSLFAYNESVVNDYFPLTKEQALAKGYRWYDAEVQPTVAQTYVVPQEIKNVTDDVVGQKLVCKHCAKNFTIIKPELVLLRKWGLPIPEWCHECRYQRRINLRNPRQFWDRKCVNTPQGGGQQCSKDIRTSYSPERPEIVYCEECYLKEVY